MLDDHLSIQVIVAARDRIAELDATLEALSRSDGSVLVIDDGSADAEAVARTVRRHGASLVRHETPQGPATARNTGVLDKRSDLIAFVDSDCLVPPGWAESLVGHFADQAVGAVAPRVVALTAGESSSARYSRAASPLDMGARPGRVVPGTRLSYVPTAALIVRTEALADIASSGQPFDAALRFGEDVDLVWRLHKAGWTIRYDPSVQVRHREPERWTSILRRRFKYGTSAGPLALRHPAEYVALRLAPWPSAVVVAVIVGQPSVAVVLFAGHVGRVVHLFRSRSIPASGSLEMCLGSVNNTFTAVGRYATQIAWPLLVAGLALGGGRRFQRRVALAALILAPIVTDYRKSKSRLNMVIYGLAHLADDISYGAGVVCGSIRGRTARPLAPRVAQRSDWPRTSSKPTRTRETIQ